MKALRSLVTDLAAVPQECGARPDFQMVCGHVNTLIRMRSTAHRARAHGTVDDALPALYGLGHRGWSAVAVYMGTPTRASNQKSVPTAVAVVMAENKGDLYCFRLEIRKQPDNRPVDSFERAGQLQNCAIKLIIVTIPEGKQYAFRQTDFFDLSNNDPVSLANVVGESNNQSQHLRCFMNLGSCEEEQTYMCRATADSALPANENGGPGHCSPA
jgi:hypothetical protein